MTDSDDGSEPTHAADVDRSAPLSDLAATVTNRDGAGEQADAATEIEGASSDSTDAFDELFDREDVTEIDGDQLWESLEADGETTAPPDEREIHEIEKGSYCHQCKHFSEPPAVTCTREGTDILAMASLEQFRVADCPVVREDEALESR